jgi:hypothetical protein
MIRQLRTTLRSTAIRGVAAVSLAVAASIALGADCDWPGKAAPSDYVSSVSPPAIEGHRLVCGFPEGCVRVRLESMLAQIEAAGRDRPVGLATGDRAVSAER